MGCMMTTTLTHRYPETLEHLTLLPLFFLACNKFYHVVSLFS